MMQLQINKHYRLRSGDILSVLSTDGKNFCGSLVGDCLSNWHSDGTHVDVEALDVVSPIKGHIVPHLIRLRKR